MKSKIPVLMGVVLTFAIATSAVAAERTYSLSNVIFSDGGVATGFFKFDTDLLPPAGFPSQSTVVDWQISVSGGSVFSFPPFEYSPQNTVATVIRLSSGEFQFVWSDFPESNRSFRIVPAALAFDGSSTIPLNLAAFSGFGNQECFDCFPQRLMISGALIPVAVTPETLLEELAVTVTGVGPGKSLLDKVTLAQTYYAVPDLQAACAILNDFGNQVRAQRGNKLSQELADDLILDVQAITTAIGCD